MPNPGARAVAGMTCISPLAPLGLTALGFPPLSAIIVMRSSVLPAKRNRRGCLRTSCLARIWHHSAYCGLLSG